MQIHNATNHSREGGIGLLLLVILLPFPLALAGAVSLTLVYGQQSVSRSTAKMNSFYAADAGAQIGNALVRSTGTSMQETTMETVVSGHASQVVVETPETDVYKVTSTSTVGGETSTVTIWVSMVASNTPYNAQSGFEVTFGNAAKVNGDIRVNMDSNAFISGEDHNVVSYPTNPSLIADQSKAVPALGVQDTGNNTDFNLKTKSNSDIKGVPQDVMTHLTGQYDTLKGIRDKAVANADVTVSGSAKLEDGDSSKFGTKANPVLAYVDLGKKDTLELNSNFEGYGILVVDMGKNADFVVDSNARWSGLVIVRPNGDPSTGNGPIVSMNSNAMVTGSLQLVIDINGTVANGHKQLYMDSDAQILYSSGGHRRCPGHRR